MCIYIYTCGICMFPFAYIYGMSQTEVAWCACKQPFWDQKRIYIYIFMLCIGVCIYIYKLFCILAWPEKASGIGIPASRSSVSYQEISCTQTHTHHKRATRNISLQYYKLHSRLCFDWSIGKEPRKLNQILVRTYQPAISLGSFVFQRSTAESLAADGFAGTAGVGSTASCAGPSAVSSSCAFSFFPFFDLLFAFAFPAFAFGTLIFSFQQLLPVWAPTVSWPR